MEKIEFENISFVIDGDYCVKKFNAESKNAFPKIECGVHCYEAIRGNCSPCRDCPLFSKDAKARVTYQSLYNNKHYFATFANIPLDDGGDGFVVSASEKDPDVIAKDHECELLRRKAEIYRKVNYYCAWGYFDVNLTKDLITSDIYEVIDEKEYSVDMGERGFTKPIKYSDYVKWLHDVKIVSKRDEYLDMTNIKNLLERFENGEKSFELTFRTRSTAGYLTWHRHNIYLYRDTKSDDVLAIYVLRDIAFKLDRDEETKRNEDVMRILASEYATVLYVDLESEIVSFCSLPKIEDEKFKNTIRDMKYPELWKYYVEQRVKNSDATRLLSLINCKFLWEYFRQKKMYTGIFRVGTEEDFKYFELKIVKTEDGDPKSLVVGIADKDEMIRAQQEQQKQLESALVLAQKDVLTGIRNRTGYDIVERRFNAEISNGTLKEFAIVMFDVNGLKDTNDIFGHENGNLLLKNSCKMICDIYKHSSVFRIGGDEFVAVLTGEDYENRNVLLEKVKKTVELNEEKGAPIYVNVSVASGMGVYDPKIDKDVDDVLRRADTLMYENKAEMKAKKVRNNK